MADVRLDILASIKGIEEATRSIERFGKSTQDSVSRVESQLDKLGNSFKRVGEVALGALGGQVLLNGLEGIVTGFKDAIKESVRFENSLLGLSAVAKATGNNVLAIENAAKDLAADGLIPLSDVSASLKNLLSSGLDADTAVKTFKALRDAAAFNRQGSLELGEAIRGASEGIKNQNSILVDNAGITKNLSVLIKEYAAETGKSTAALTDQQKAQAIASGIIREGAIFQDNYNVLLGTFSGALTKVEGETRILSKTIGDLVTKNQSAQAAVFGFAESIKNVRLSIESYSGVITSAIRVTLELVAAFALLSAVNSLPAIIAAVRVALLEYSSAAGVARLATLGLQATALGLIAGVIEIGVQFNDLINTFGGFKNALKATAIGFAQIINSTLEAVVGFFRLDDALLIAQKNTKFLVNALDSLRKTEGPEDIKRGIDGIASGASKAAKSIDSQLVKSLDNLQKKYKNSGLERLDILKRERDEALKNIQEIVDQDVRLAKRGAELKRLVVLDFEKKTRDEIEKINKEAEDQRLKQINDQRKRINALASGEVQQIITELQIKATLDSKDLGAIGASVAKAFKDGAQGAQKVFSAAVALGIESFAPGMGQVASQFVDLLAQGPQKVRETINEFLGAIPQLVTNVVGSIPILIQAIIDNLPLVINALIAAIPDVILAVIAGIPSIIFAIIDAVPQIILAIVDGVPQVISKFVDGVPEIITSFVERIPAVISKLVERAPDIIAKLITQVPEIIAAIVAQAPQIAAALAAQAPFIAISLVKSLITEIPTFVKALASGLFDAVKNVFSPFSGGSGSSSSQTGKPKSQGIIPDFIPFLGRFAEGGLVPKGFPNDSFPARLTSGEQVITPGVTEELEDFLSKQKKGADQQQVVAALARLESAILRQPVVVNIGGKAITQVIREELQSGRVIGL